MSDRCYVATRKGLFTVDRGASKWSISRATFVGDNVTLMMQDARTGDLFAALNHGHFGIKMHRSRNHGETWSETAVPQYPPMPEGYTPKPNPFNGRPLDWALKLIWGLAPGGSDERGVVWCGTMPGGLFKSENNGESWDPNGAEYPGIHSNFRIHHWIVVDQRRQRRFLADRLFESASNLRRALCQILR